MITKKIERLTSQKKIILDYLKSVKTHPTAEVVYRAVKKQLPQISKGTVYRNLNNLKQRGKILEISHDVARFDGDTLPHGHFFCECCGQIFDIFQNFKACRALKGKRLPGKINHYQIYFYGTCKQCLQAGKKTK